MKAFPIQEDLRLKAFNENEIAHHHQNMIMPQGDRLMRLAKVEVLYFFYFKYDAFVVKKAIFF